MKKPKSIEKRWAVLVIFDDVEFLAGRYCWPDGDYDEAVIRTFRTRKLARKARNQMTSYRKIAKLIRIKLVVVDDR